MISFQNETGTFNYRVAAVIYHSSGDGRVLVQRDAAPDAYHSVLPGGRCDIGESSHECIVREMREELGVTARAERLLYIVENLFHRPGGAKMGHGIEFYYLVTLQDGDLHAKTGPWNFFDGGMEITNWWTRPEALADTFPLLPRFLPNALLRHLPAVAQHIVNDERISPTAIQTNSAGARL